VTQSTPVLLDIKPRLDLHAVPVPEVYKKLGTRPEGLTEAEIKERQNRFGRNRILKVKGKPLVLKLLANFTHLKALLLWIGGVVGFIANMPQLGLAIWTVNLINGAFSFWQEYKAEKAKEALLRLLPPNARVLRDGNCSPPFNASLHILRVHQVLRPNESSQTFLLLSPVDLIKCY
jgi:magnesium-transporting ATPase (P-type)